MLDIWPSSPLKLSKHCPDDYSIPSLYQFPAAASRSYVRVGSFHQGLHPHPLCVRLGYLQKAGQSRICCKRLRQDSTSKEQIGTLAPHLSASPPSRMQFLRLTQ